MGTENQTLAYAVDYLFNQSKDIDFTMGGKNYQHVKTINHSVEGNCCFSTLEIAYDYEKQKYVIFNLNDRKIGNRKVSTHSRGWEDQL